jgi:hypothetical protein
LFFLNFIFFTPTQNFKILFLVEIFNLFISYSYTSQSTNNSSDKYHYFMNSEKVLKLHYFLFCITMKTQKILFSFPFFVYHFLFQQSLIQVRKKVDISSLLFGYCSSYSSTIDNSSIWDYHFSHQKILSIHNSFSDVLIYRFLLMLFYNLYCFLQQYHQTILNFDSDNTTL